MPLTLSTEHLEVVLEAVNDAAAAAPAAAADRPVRSDALDALGVAPSYLAACGFDGAVGATSLLPSPGGAVDGAVPIAVGLGSERLTAADVRKAAASLWRSASKVDSLVSTLPTAAAADLGADGALSAVVEGMLLASYRFDEYKGEPAEADPLKRIVLAVPEGTDTAAALDRAAAVAGGIALARDLVNQPAGALTAAGLAAAAVEAVDAARASSNPKAGSASAEVWDRDRLVTERCGGLLGVNAGSTEPPALVRLRWQPTAEPRAAIQLVGKGITFDTGGLNLKSFEGMEWMKIDMGGAAAVIGAMSAVIRLAPDVAVTGICCCTDNQPGPTATKPGDVLHIRNGTTVEVLNTDAEGRLVLADGLSLAVEEAPDLVIDLATLTGACMVALGEKYAGLMGNDEAAIERAQAAGRAAGELLWHLPLPPEYREQLDSPIADLRNIGKNRYGGALHAGLFLSEFVGDTPWLHLDIAGPVRTDADAGEASKGATGFGVRTLVELICGW
ncbi:leucyl aminopeptidase [Candidatus Poriferisodalis sp.]|uniref:leucyl aminopeptidase n=1 Tax=Candidatus Poriferisodalis sp. TaxID=3101277 RepID=UPI003B02B820